MGGEKKRRGRGGKRKGRRGQETRAGLGGGGHLSALLRYSQFLIQPGKGQRRAPSHRTRLLPFGGAVKTPQRPNHKRGSEAAGAGDSGAGGGTRGLRSASLAGPTVAGPVRACLLRCSEQP